MITYKIYLGKKKDKEQLGSEISYSYNGEVIDVYKNDKLVYSKLAKPNDALVLIFKDNKVKLEKQKIPKEKGACIAWLLGFNQHQRFKRLKNYEDCCRAQKQEYSVFNYTETNYESDKYKLTYFSYEDSKKPIGIAAIVNDDLSKEEILELIPLMIYHPEWYVRRILKKRFEISEDEFLNAK